MATMFFFLSSSFFFFRLASSILHKLLTGFMHKTACFSYGEVHNPIAFCITSKYHKELVATHSKTMASTLGHHFLHLYSARTLQEHLAMTQSLLLKIA